MRLTQVEGKEDSSAPVKPQKASEEEIAILKEITQEMHRTMLDADQVMRRLAQILEKY